MFWDLIFLWEQIQNVPDDTGCKWWLFPLLLNLLSISFNEVVSCLVCGVSENVAGDILTFIFCPPPTDIQDLSLFFFKQLELDTFHFLSFKKNDSDWLIKDQNSWKFIVLLRSNGWILASLAMCHFWGWKKKLRKLFTSHDQPLNSEDYGTCERRSSSCYMWSCKHPSLQPVIVAELEWGASLLVFILTAITTGTIGLRGYYHTPISHLQKLMSFFSAHTLVFF